MVSPPNRGHEEGLLFTPKFAPSPSAVTVVDLSSSEASKITNVNLYTNSRAEITRIFKFTLTVAGAHQLNIIGLPRTMDRDSLRVESRGMSKPTIQDVSISTVVPPHPNATTSHLLSSLRSKETTTQKSLKRTVNSISSLNTYLASLKAAGLDVSKLKAIIKEYDDVAGELDEKALLLEEELEVTRKAINEEYQRLTQPTTLDSALNTKTTVVIFAESAGETEIVLIYAVRNATWNAAYDIRVSTSPTKPTTATLIYKALISQSTGEPWTDVPLTLHTTAPTFGADVHVPVLHPWAVYVYRPEIHGSLGGGAAKKRKSSMMINSSALLGGVEEEERELKHSGPPGGGGGAIPPPPPPPPLPEMKHRGLQVSSAKGGVSATFSVPGLIVIPSDADGSPASWHNVTIATLTLDAKMSWECVAKKDTRVFLKAKIKNASEYTLLPGSASVYVDGSFISKSDVPLVSPEEKFDCPLGVDPSIRVTYHPRTKTVTRGSSNLKFYASSTTKHAFTQRITLHNTKPPTLNEKQQDHTNVNLRLIDQFPVSEDSTIRVKLIQPPLVFPSSTLTNGSNEKGNTKMNQQVMAPSTGGSVTVGPGVTARWDWDGADDEEVEDSRGVVSFDPSTETDSHGRFLWDCSIPPQERVVLAMQWEVLVPNGVPVNVDEV